MEYLLTLTIGGTLGIAAMLLWAGHVAQRVKAEQDTIQQVTEGWRDAFNKLAAIIDGGGGGAGDPNNQLALDELSERLRRIATGDASIQEGEGGTDYRGPYGNVGDDPTDEAWPTPPSDGLRNRVAMVEPGTDLITELTGMRNDGVPHDLSGEMYNGEP